MLAEIPQDNDFDQGAWPLTFSRDGRFVLRLDGPHLDERKHGTFGERLSFLPWQPADVIKNACGRSIRKGLEMAVWDNYLKGQPYRETCALQ